MKHFGLWIGMGALMMSAAAQAATAKRSDAGTLKDGTKIEAITLSNSHGVSARIISFGATLQSLSAPDKHGKIADVTLGYDKASDYEAKPNYFGVTVGVMPIGSRAENSAWTGLNIKLRSIMLPIHSTVAIWDLIRKIGP